MSQSNLNKYNKLIQNMEKCNYQVNPQGKKVLSQDKELYHMEQDVIYRTFIKDIASGKIKNFEEIVSLAKLVNNKVVKNDKGMMYA